MPLALSSLQHTQYPYTHSNNHTHTILHTHHAAHEGITFSSNLILFLRVIFRISKLLRMKETFALLWACLSGTIYAVSIIDVAPLFREPASEDVEYKNCVADIDRALSSEGAFVATGVPGIHTASAMQAAGGLFSSDSAALEEVGLVKSLTVYTLVDTDLVYLIVFT